MNIVVTRNAIAFTLSTNDFVHLAKRCAPSVPPQVLEGVAQTESGLDPYALHDNKTGTRDQPKNLAVAETEAAQWMRRGDSIDVGLMQINSANFRALKLTLKMALDPCDSMHAGATVLQAAYDGGKTPATQEVALLMALSRYNTGTPFAGILNGYAHSVLTNMKADNSIIETNDDDTRLVRNSTAPLSWNVAEIGSRAVTHGAPWLAFPLNTSQGSPVWLGPAGADTTTTATREVLTTSQ